MHDTKPTEQGKPQPSASESANDVEPRGNPATERPYCWQSKPALRIIRASYGDDRRLPYLMSAYLALTEIASDEGRPTFTKSVADLLSKAGGSDRMMRDCLGFLKDLSLLHIRKNFVHRDTEKGKAPSTYTLLSVRHDAPDPPAQCAAPSGTEEIPAVPIKINNANAITEKNSAQMSCALRVRDEKRAAAKQKRLADAFTRIETVGGVTLAEAMRGNWPRHSAASILELAAMPDDDIKKCRGLLLSGWKLARVKKYKFKDADV